MHLLSTIYTINNTRILVRHAGVIEVSAAFIDHIHIREQYMKGGKVITSGSPVTRYGQATRCLRSAHVSSADRNLISAPSVLSDPVALPLKHFHRVRGKEERVSDGVIWGEERMIMAGSEGLRWKGNGRRMGGDGRNGDR